MSYQLHIGDSLDILKTLPANSIDSVVTDPPYGLEFMGKAWDKYTPSAFQNWCEQWAAECLRVLKPGGHLVAFGGTRTYHRLASGIEDAGFEIRDKLDWIYGSGFPKSLDVSKAIDKAAPREGLFDAFAAHFFECWKHSGMRRSDFVSHFPHYKNAESVMAQLSNWKLAKNVPSRQDFEILRGLIGLSDEWGPLINREESAREVTGKMDNPATSIYSFGEAPISRDVDITAPSTDAAKQWEGWGTALKPAHEPIVLARKPLSEKTVAANVLEHGTGGLNIDGSRVVVSDNDDIFAKNPSTKGGFGHGAAEVYGTSAGADVYDPSAGRWPPNILLSHSPYCTNIRQRRIEDPASWDCSEGCPVAEMDRQSGTLTSALRGKNYSTPATNEIYGKRDNSPANPENTYGDTGGASRFFPIIEWGCALDCPVAEMDRQSGISTSPGNYERSTVVENHVFGASNERKTHTGHADTGGASRFFPVIERDDYDLDDADYVFNFKYQAKAAKKERPSVDGVAAHPTVKPVALMRWLVKLVTPPGGTVLEPFGGSGTTAEACELEGFDCIIIEREPDYGKLINARMTKYSKEGA